MAENVYEGMFILDSNRYGRDPEGVSGRVSKLIEKAGGRLLVSRLWEERRLAYTIRGHRKGTYWLTYFHLDGAKLAEVERNCHLNDAFLRVLFLKVDPRIVDTLLAHAQPDTETKKDTDASEKAAKGPVPATVAELDKPEDDSPADSNPADSNPADTDKSEATNEKD